MKGETLETRLKAEDLKEGGDVELIDNINENLVNQIEDKADNRAQEGNDDRKDAGE